MSDKVAIAVALIAIGGPLLGVWIGWRLGRAERIEQWRRDQQIEAYSELVASGVDVAHAATLALVATEADEIFDAQRQMAASSIRFHNATHRARIVASSSVRPWVDELVRLTMGALEEFRNSSWNEQVIDNDLKGAAVVRDLLSEQARQDFGFARGGLRRAARRLISFQ